MLLLLLLFFLSLPPSLPSLRYCVMLDMDESLVPAHFLRDWLITGAIVCFEGYLCVSGIPRKAGKQLLKWMPGVCPLCLFLCLSASL